MKLAQKTTLCITPFEGKQAFGRALLCWLWAISGILEVNNTITLLSHKAPEYFSSLLF